MEKFAFIWVDSERRYLISNTSSLKPGLPYTRDTLRQVNNSTNTDPFCVEFDINKPRVDESYYSRKLKIDDSNRTRQDNFQLERKLTTKDWSIKVNPSIIGMDDVDTYYLGKACYWWGDRNTAELYYNLT